MKHKRICNRCKEPIHKAHRWHYVHRKFLFWTITNVQHRDCQHPTEIHKYVKRLKGEVPLPFEQVDDNPMGMTFSGGTKMQEAITYKKDVN
jgi:hypothetical protein